MLGSCHALADGPRHEQLTFDERILEDWGGAVESGAAGAAHGCVAHLPPALCPVPLPLPPDAETVGRKRRASTFRRLSQAGNVRAGGPAAFHWSGEAGGVREGGREGGTPSHASIGKVVPDAENLLAPAGQVMMPDVNGSRESLDQSSEEEYISNCLSSHHVARLSPELILLVLSFCAPGDKLQVGFFNCSFFS